MKFVKCAKWETHPISLVMNSQDSGNLLRTNASLSRSEISANDASRSSIPPLTLPARPLFAAMRHV